MPSSISDEDEIIGSSFGIDLFEVHGFLRNRNGKIVAINGPHAVATFPEGISLAGAIVGNYLDATGQHGFLRERNGKFITLTFPGATSTDAKEIDSHGTITGNYSRANGHPHGFVLLRNCHRCSP
jgi:hypothetical protein